MFSFLIISGSSVPTSSLSQNSQFLSVSSFHLDISLSSLTLNPLVIKDKLLFSLQQLYLTICQKIFVYIKDILCCWGILENSLVIVSQYLKSILTNL